MSGTSEILCPIYLFHFVADREPEYLGDFHLPDLQISKVIEELIDKFDLQGYRDAPQSCQPTLHRYDAKKPNLEAQLGHPLDPRQTPRQAGITPGSWLCLVLTPQYIPLTIHWSAGSQEGSIERNLATGKSIREHIDDLITELQLQDRVDGPMQSIASLHREASGPALPPDKNLLDLRLSPHSQLWLKIEPRFLPVTVRIQFPSGGVHEEQRYLALDRTIVEHHDDLINTIPAVRNGVEGPQRCTAELRRDGSALPRNQTLRELQLPEHATLQLVLTPTSVDVTLYLPTGDDGQYEPVRKTLPLNAPIRGMIGAIAREYRLASAGLTLAPSPDAPAWNANRTLADCGVKTGAVIWVRRKRQAYPPFIVIGGAAIAAVALIAIAIALGLGAFRGERPTAAATTEDAAPSLTPISSSSSPALIPTPTRTADEQKRSYFALGLEAYDRQDWPAAAAAFKEVWAIDPAYLDTDEKLAATHYNWAVSVLDNPDQARQALAILGETFVYSPTHQLGRELEAKLDRYVRGLDAFAAGDAASAIELFEQVRSSDPNFLDANARLYEALMAQSRQQREANQPDAARAACARAAALPGIDTAAAQQCIAALQPTPTPQLAPTPLRGSLYVYRKDQDPNRPQCLSIRIEGINSSGWYFTVDGLGFRGNFRGGDAANCDLQPGQQVTFSIYNASGRLVSGGRGIPAKGGDIFIGEWRQ